MTPSKFYIESKFAQIFIEKGARDYALTKSILNRFPKSHLVEIDRYQEVFNRSRQNWRDSKIGQKLIIAKKTEPFLYPASDVIQGAKNGGIFYTTPILNCIYDCDYCFLQGKFNSAHAVIFVNDHDFFSAAKQQLNEGPFTLCPSYETDLLAFQSIAPWWSSWVEFATRNPSVTVELRSKSSVSGPILALSPVNNVILSWSIAPHEISHKYEKGTPMTNNRLNAARVAIDHGWKVRLCIDPILPIKGWQDIYRGFIRDLAAKFPVRDVMDIWVGTFRMNSEHLNRIKSQRDDSDILFYPFKTEGENACYSLGLRDEINEFMKGELAQVFPQQNLSFW